MKCIAIWYSNKSKQTSSSIEAHFNLWKLKKSRKVRCFLDIGILVQNVDAVSHINIYIPELVHKHDIEDLGIVFRENTDLVSSLFNEDYRVSLRANQKFLEVIDDAGKAVFYIHIIDKENDITVENGYSGSTIRIKMPEEISETSHYYRIRLINPYVDSISSIYTPTNSILESAFYQTEMVDFRVNEKRNLSNSLLEKINQDGGVTFTKTHLFVMREANEDYIYSHRPPNNSRQLESDLWKEYIGNKYSFDNIVAYNWKETAKHNSFNAFVKFRSIRCNPVTIGTFIFVLIVLGILSGIIANLICK